MKSSTVIETNPLERHYRATEIAELWSLDVTTIRKIFQDEPGVLRLGRSGRRDGKRDYVSIRIPESVMRRVFAKLTGTGTRR